MTRCECCGQEVKHLFSVLSRERGFNCLDGYCSECAQLVNDEYPCGVFRSLVSFASLPGDPSVDTRFTGLLVA